MAKNYNNRIEYKHAVRVGSVDEGLRAYMIGVYNLMALGLGLTGIVAYIVASQPALIQLFLGTPLRWLVMLAPLGIVVFFSMRIHSLSVQAARSLFWVFAGVMGISMASIFLAFTHQSIARVFFVTACAFGATSLYGYTTKTDLTNFGSFLFMGLIGILVAYLVNLFLHSTALQFLVSVVGVLVFTGLTAYDTQLIKESYYAAGITADESKKVAIMGALRLYLDVINLFLMLLNLFGEKR